MSENGFWTVVWLIGGLVMMFLIGSAVWAGDRSSQRATDRIVACLNNGGDPIYCGTLRRRSN